MLNMVILPRQAPDKHRKSGGKKRLCAGPTEILPQSQFLSNDSHMSPSHPQKPSVSRALFGQGSSGIAGQGAEEAKGTEAAQCYECVSSAPSSCCFNFWKFSYLTHCWFITHREAVAELGWPNRTERLVVPAGTVVLTHFDVFHRGTHGPVAGEPYRLMLKLWYCRQQDNTGGPTWDHHPAEVRKTVSFLLLYVYK
jgi:hypothetical protein